MAKNESIYSRLTARRRTLSGYTQLWLAGNHILLVKSTRFVEEYRRFALADIQAIVITGRAQRTSMQAAGVLAAIGWIGGVLAVNSIFAKGFFALTGALAFAMVIADIARGPRCICQVQTAVSREVLAPVSRLRNARKFLARIQPAIEAVQGTLTPGQLVGGLRSYEPDVVKPPQVQLPRGYGAEILFALMLVDSMLVVLDRRFPDSDAGSVLFATMGAEFVLASLVLIREGTQNLRKLIPSLALVALLCIGWDGLGLVRSLVRWGSELVAAAQQGKAFTASFLWSHSRQEAWFSGLWRLALGLSGLTALYFERKEARR